MRYWLVILIALMLIPTGAFAASWTYTSSNVSSPWTCPAGVTNITLEIIGGGGSGRGGQSVTYAGGAGSLGEHFTYARLPVTPGNTYTIAVGAGGTISAYNMGSNPGGSTTGFGKTASGGAGGIILSSNGDGGSAQNGWKVTTRLATNGTGSDGRLGGTSGLGYGAPGGGGSHDTSVPYDTSGGPGASGLMIITDFADYDGNLPAFAADDTEIPYGSVVHFTDQSSITETTDLQYLWDFGDGETSDTIGDVSHVYAYMGSFDVSLTINSSAGAITETKSGYINVVTQEAQEIDLTGTPQVVVLHVQDSTATNVVGATVNITGVSTSSGNWSWVDILTGVDLAGTSINTALMTQTTDSLGNAQFMLIPTVKYTVVVSNGGTTYSTLTIVPSERLYVIVFTAGSASSIRFIEPDELLMTGTPNPVTFKVSTFFGNPIVGASVSAVPISTSTGDWDWLPQLLGIPLGEIALNSTTMTATTDSQGEVTFLCIPTVKYNVTPTKEGYTFQTLIVTPNLRNYVIAGSLLEESYMFGNAAGTSTTVNNVSMTVARTKLNSTHGRLNITVLDTTSSITGGNIYIYRHNQTLGGNPILVDTLAGVDSDYSTSVTVALNTTATDFTVNGTFTSSRSPSTVYRSVPAGFERSAVAFAWFDSPTLFGIAIIIIAVTLLFGGGFNQFALAGGCLFIEFILFYYLGWFEYAIERLGGSWGILAGFFVACILVVWYFASDWWKENSR